MILQTFKSVLFTGVLWTLLGNGLGGQIIRVAGSDFAGAALDSEGKNGETLGAYTVEYQMTGSLLGLIKLREGFADVALVLQAGDYPSLEGLTSVPLGFWGVYIVVQEENPLSEVSIEGLAGIVRKTRDGLKSEWGTLLPNQPQWANRLIFVNFIMKKTDPSFPVLLDRFFDNKIPPNFSALGERIENPYLAGASNLLILSRIPESGKGLRVLSIIPEGQTVGFPPSKESMHFGDYPLRTSLFLVARNPRSPKVRTYVRDFFESNRLNLLSQTGLVEAPESVQKQALLEFDLEF